MARSKPEPNTKLTSWSEVQSQESTILARLHAEPALTLAALANPLLALEELGYQIDDDLKQEIEDRLRFPKNHAQIATLRKKIFEVAGKPFALNSAESLHVTLSSLLGKKVASSLTLSDTALVFAVPGEQNVADPLDRLEDAHPIVKALVQYRRLQATVPPFSTRDMYDDIRQGNRTPLVSNIVVHTGRGHKIVGEI
jgi:DNA polymerase I-like protein with 3'-5' exonuclease and polymerase domains